jgi:hypothetical protein
MNTKYPVVNDDRQRQKIKHVRKIRPHMRRPILPYALGIKAVSLWKGGHMAVCMRRETACLFVGGNTDLGYSTRLMVASDQLYTVRVTELQTRQQGNGLHAEESSVDVVACKPSCISSKQVPRESVCALRVRTEKKIIRIGRIAAYAKYFDEVVKLTWVPDQQYAHRLDGRSSRLTRVCHRQQLRVR